jgi:type IV pilus assembly protein PilE
MHKQSSRGFSLIELMVVVAIIAIIAAFAYPSYIRQVQATRQSAAQGDMMSFASVLENYRAQNFSYEGAGDPDVVAPPDNDAYQIRVEVAADFRSYEMIAVPVGQQAGTGAMVLNNRGQNCLDPGNDAACVIGTDPSWKK